MSADIGQLIRLLPLAHHAILSIDCHCRRNSKRKSPEAFKAPSLRNIVLTPPYFHSGKVWKLRDAVELMGSVQLGIHLTPEEVDKTVTFLRTLTGKQPKLEHPVLPPSTDATPHPMLK